MTDHVVAAAGDDDAPIDIAAQREEVAHVVEAEYPLQRRNIEVQPPGLHVHEDAHALHTVQRVLAHEAAVHDVRARGRDGLLAVQPLEDIEQGIDGASALHVGRQLPALVAGRAHDAIELFGLDEERAARVGIGLPVKLAAERSVGHALVGGADALPAIQRDLERAEAQPVVTLVGGPRRSPNLGDDLLDGARGVDPPGQDDADRQLSAAT